MCRHFLIQESSLTDGKELFYIQSRVNKLKASGSAFDNFISTFISILINFIITDITTKKEVILKKEWMKFLAAMLMQSSQRIVEFLGNGYKRTYLYQ